MGVGWLGVEVGEGEGEGGRGVVREVRYLGVGAVGGGEEREERRALRSSLVRSLRVGWGVVGGSSRGWEGSGLKVGGGGSDGFRGVFEGLLLGGGAMGVLGGSEVLHSQPIFASSV